MLLKQLTLLLFVSSCALFKGSPSLQTMDQEKLLDAVVMTGEGRGRLSFNQSQYLFGFDSIFKENFDWILAVQIPLHGEEVLILPNLKNKTSQDSETQSFEARIQYELSQHKIYRSIDSKKFTQDLRSLMRFHFAPNWKGKRDCQVQQSETVCKMEGEVFRLSSTNKVFRISKSLDQGKILVLEGNNLTETNFAQTNIRLFLNEAEMMKKNSAFSLELFWQK